MANARTSLEEKEEALARANLVIASGHDFCGVSLQMLENSLDDGELCPWSFNRVIDLMYADLPTEEVRDLVSSLLIIDDVLVHHKMLIQAIHHQKVKKKRLHLDLFDIPPYLLHPPIGH